MSLENIEHVGETSKVAKRSIEPVTKPKLRERIGKFLGMQPSPELLEVVRGFSDGTLLGGDPKELRPDVGYTTSRNPSKERIFVTVTQNGRELFFSTRRDEDGKFIIPEPIFPHVVEGKQTEVPTITPRPVFRLIKSE